MKRTFASRRTWLLVAIIIGSFPLFRIVFWNSYSSPRPLSNAPEVQQQLIKVQNLDFGEVWETRNFEWTLAVDNLTDQDVTIENFDTSCVCSKIEPASLELRAGASVSVKLILNLERTRKSEDTNSVRDFSLHVRPRVSSPMGFRQPAWTVRGRVRSAFHISDDEIDFGAHSEYSDKPRPKGVIATPEGPIANLRLQCNSSYFQVSDILQDDAKHNVVVSMRPAIPIGSHEAEILLIGLDKSGIEYPARRLKARAVVLCDVQPRPRQLLLGVRQIGQSVANTVELRNCA